MHSVAKSPITCYKVMNMYMGKCRRTGRPLNSVHYPSESFYYIGDTITASIDADTYYLDKMNKSEKTHLCNVYNKPRIKNKNRCHMTSLLCKINWNLTFLLQI